MGVPRWSYGLALLVACAAAPARNPGEAEVRAAPDAGTASTPSLADAGTSALPLFRLPADVHATGERVSLEIIPDHEGFSGQVEIDLVLDRARADLFVSSRELGVLRGTFRGGSHELPIRAEPDDARGIARLITPSGSFPAGPATLRLEFEGRFNGRLVGAYRLKTPAGWAVFTQFEPIDARRAFPCLDEPGFKIPWTVELTVPERLQAFGNAPVAHEETAGNGLKRVQFQPTRPLPSYLVAFAVGDLDVRAAPLLAADSIRARSLQIRGIASKGRGDELGYALRSARELVPLLERWFGLPYPYEKLDLVAEPDFVYGGMENPGLITFSETALLAQEGQASEDDRFWVAMVVAHELSHSWFGDLVTMRFWDDLWLNESFATFLTPEIVGGWKPRLGAEMVALESALRAMKNDELESSAPMRRPIRSEGDITGSDEAVIYPKGAAVLRMLQGLLGPEAFRAAVRRYLVAHADGNATMEDLVGELSRDRDIRAAAISFIDQPGIPLVRGRVECDARGARLVLHQERARSLGSSSPDLRWVVPVCVRLQNVPGQRCTLLDREQGILDLGTTRCPRWAHLNANGSGYYRWLVPDRAFHALAKEWPALARTERLSAADALFSGALDGAIPAEDVLAHLSPLARDTEPSVPNAAMLFLLKTRLDWTAPEQDDALRAFLRRELRPALDRLGWSVRKGEPSRVTLLRSDLVRFLALDAGDPDVLARAAALGRRWIDAGGKIERGAVPPDLRDSCVRAAGNAGGTATFDALERILRGSDDSNVRYTAALGLAASNDPGLAARARELVVAPGLRSNDRWLIIQQHAKRPELREAMRRWIVTHQKELPAVLPERKLSYLPEVLAGCSEDVSEQLASLGPLVKETPGLEYFVQKAREQTRLCVAVRQVQAPSVAAFLTRAPVVWQRAASR